MFQTAFFRHENIRLTYTIYMTINFTNNAKVLFTEI